MERRSDPDLNQVLRRASGPRAGTVVDARMTLALWLRAGRSQRGLSLEDVARVTKIQVRILERLEAGKPDGLPADVFVRGFVRSVAKCVGLDETEALRRYSACNGTAQASPAARAMVEAMTELAPSLGQQMRPSTASDLASGSAKDLPILTNAPAMLDFIAGAPAGAVETVDLDDGYDSIDVVVDPVEPAPTVIEAVAQAVIKAAAPAAPAAPAAGDAVAVSSTDTADEPAPAKKKRAKRTTVAKPRASKRKTATARMATGTPAEPTAIVEAIADAVAAKAIDTRAPAPEATVVEPKLAAGANVIDPASASDELFAPNLTVYAPDDLFGPRPYEPEVVATATAREPDDAKPAAQTQLAVDAEMVETFGDEVIATATWQPKMPPLATTTSVPWRRPGVVSSAPVASLVAVIDDADPEGAERLLEERRASTTTQRRSFLPPILLDREDRSARQGGLTLAVIILLIAATLTLSYLMRRPSSSGDGVTQRDVAAETLA
ncbi:MAG: helix-turn-helix domain-containing protein [Kofleriaceae bacterium]